MSTNNQQKRGQEITKKQEILRGWLTTLSKAEENKNEENVRHLME